MHNCHRVDRVCAVHGVLMNTVSAETFVVGGDDDPVVVNERLKAGNPLVNLRRAARSEVQREFSSGIRLR